MSQAIAAPFQRLTHGVYVIGVGAGDACNAFTAAWAMQVAFDPLLLALSISTRHASYDLLRRSGAFSVNVLKAGDLALAAHFGQPAGADKLASVAWTVGRLGVPLLADAIAWFECRLTAEHPAGPARALMLGEVVDARLLDAAAAPMLYRDTGDMDGATAFFPDAIGPSSGRG